MRGKADDSSFDREFRGLFVVAHRVAYRLLGQDGEAEEVAQEALARAYASWPKVSACRSSEAWVSRVSANLAIDVWRRRRRAEAGGRRLDDSGALAGPDERRVDLHRALSGLSGRQREVVVLRYLADLPEQDVAALLGCSVGTVKQHASRGLAALRTSLLDPAPGR